jgi:hypothetical protein
MGLPLVVVGQAIRPWLHLGLDVCGPSSEYRQSGIFAAGVECLPLVGLFGSTTVVGVGLFGLVNAGALASGTFGWFSQ